MYYYVIATQIPKKALTTIDSNYFVFAYTNLKNLGEIPPSGPLSRTDMLVLSVLVHT